ncbi:O-antigen ligase [Clostridium amylolyticum]|uniref:O-antigen ligase n=1 Tax=Clostridium amylolyticum TaxID=1121298 RepID=A0A1M6MAT5_9CLOT|nr:O-antigen ligase family protein [Clostridium amylolyticum]SHJ80575.1 O-antigen ligase [Clostridium amylolyticum]
MKQRTLDKVFLIFFCIYFFASMVLPNTLKITGKIGISEALFILIVLFYFIVAFSRENGIKNFFISISEFFTHKLYISLTLLLVLMAISISYSLEKPLAIGESIRFFTYIVSGFIAINEFKEISEKELLINTFIFASLVISLVGLGQMFTGKGMTVDIMINGINVPRMESTLGNPNSLGAFAVIAFFPVLMLGIHTKNIKIRALYFILDFLLLVNMMMSFSRNSWLALAFGVVILTISYSWKIIFILIGGGFISLLVPSIMDRVKQFGDMSVNSSRLNIWAIALKIIKDNPIKGVGIGNFIAYYDIYIKNYPDYDMKFYRRFPTHNDYLKIQSELGILGTLTFLSSLLFSLIEIFKASRLKRSRYSFFYKGFLVSFLCFLMLNLFDNTMGITHLSIALWILIFNARNNFKTIF